MANTVEENAYCQWWTEGEKNVLVCKWKPETAQMPVEDFKQQTVIFADKVEAEGLRAMCSDNRSFRFPMTPEIGEWYTANVMPRFQKADMRIAFVFDESLIGFMPKGVQTNEADGHTLTEQYFSDYEAAFAWLTS